MADVTACTLPIRPDGRLLRGRVLTGYLRFVERLEGLGATLLEPHWLGTMTPHRVRCAAGHDCNPRPNNVVNGRGVCMICAGIDPESAEKLFRSRVEEHGGTVLGKYVNTNTPVLVRCAYGHLCSPTPGNVRGDRGLCRVCAGQDQEASEVRFRERLDELGATLLEPRWLGADEPHRVRCAAGHDCNPRPNNAVRYGICKICAGQDPATAEARFQARVAELGGTVTGEYVNNNTKVAVTCGAGHKAAPVPSNVLGGQGICAPCAGRVWDVFYVVTGADGVKIGITSGDPHPRLKNHLRDGYGTVVRLHEGLPGATARDLERELLSLMRVSGVEPIRGREYFPVAVLPTILHVVDGRLGDTDKQTITSEEN